jgi:aryl-alcohol dehydrogenase-like predicted oxidoreductase
MSGIILGTANFGSEYGVSSKGKKLSGEDIKEIVRWAQSNDINHFDTALAYGNSTANLGTYLDNSLDPLVDTKLDEKSCQSSKLIVENAIASRDRLGVKQLSVLYLHNEALIHSSLVTEISKGLKKILDLGIAKRIGISVYSEAAILTSKAEIPELSVFQVPENICDRRLIDSKEVQRLSEEGNSFFIRSVFLQGLLLMEPALIPEKLKSANSTIQELNSFASSNSITTLDLCLAYAKAIPWAKKIIVGVASLHHLKEIKKSSSLLPAGWTTSISTLPLEIIDPRGWSA